MAIKKDDLFRDHLCYVHGVVDYVPTLCTQNAVDLVSNFEMQKLLQEKTLLIGQAEACIARANLTYEKLCLHYGRVKTGPSGEKIDELEAVGALVPICARQEYGKRSSHGNARYAY